MRAANFRAIAASVWLSSILSFLDQMDEGDFYLSFVEVMPDARGQ
jgi:hypothetical protein